jgi:predicted Zn-dependent peptidase
LVNPILFFYNGLMSFRRIFLLILTTAACAGAAELALEKRVVEYTTTNGIKVLLLERPFSPTVSIRMIFRTGSVDEVTGKTGLAHMFEHMMFKGTRTLGTKNYQKETPLLVRIDQLRAQLAQERARGDKADQAKLGRLIDQVSEAEKQAEEFALPNELWNLYEREGASNLNAGTAPDLTQYVVDLPSNKLELWAILDSDRLKNPVFRQFYPEREVVKEERRMRVDTNPDGKLYETFMSVAFSSHPYRNPTIGWAADLDNLTVKDMSDFYRKHYTPNRLTIVIVGDIRPQETIAMINKYFGDWRPPADAAYEVTVQEAPQTAPRRQSVEFDAGPRMLMGFHVPRYPDPDTFALGALAHLLGEGQSSRLHQNLVERKRLAAAVDSDSASPGERYDPLFILAATPRQPNTSEDVEKAIWQELERLKNEPVEPWELEKVRARVKLDILNTLQTNEGMAATLAYYQCIFRDWRYLLAYQKAMDALTAADIQRVAKRIFRTENSTVVARARKAKEDKKK